MVSQTTWKEQCVPVSIASLAALVATLSAGAAPQGAAAPAPTSTLLTPPAVVRLTLALDRVASVMSIDAVALRRRVVAYDGPSTSSHARVVKPLVLQTGLPRFLVADQRPGWVHVYLPVRPNQTLGWLPASSVRLQTNPYSVSVDRASHRLQASYLGVAFADATVAIGKASTPTPPGRYFVTTRVRTEASGPYGPYAFGLSGFSPTLATFNGLDAQISMHGTNEPDQLGQSVSHGCIRMPNTVVRTLWRRVPLGTPVDIT